MATAKTKRGALTLSADKPAVKLDADAKRPRAKRGNGIVRDDRVGTALLGARVSKQALKQFGILAKQADKKNGELLRDLVNDFLEKKQVGRIA